MSSLAERFSLLANTTPSFQDPEEEIDSETAAQVVSKNDVQKDGESEGTNTHSQLRKSTALLLSDFDPRYAGKKVSRKNLKSDSLSESEEDSDLDIDSFRNQLENAQKVKVGNADDFSDQSGNSDDGNLVNLNDDDDDSEMRASDLDKDEDSAEDDDDKVNRFEGDSSEEDDDDDSAEDDEDDSAEDDEDDSGEDEEDDDAIKLVPDKEDMIQKFSKIDINEEIQKGKAVQTQLALWDRLLEVRIKLQKLLAITNRLPQFDTHKAFQEIGGKEYMDQLSKGKKNTKRLLDNLLHLQEDILGQHPDTKQLLEPNALPKNSKGKMVQGSDEEIPSDTEDELDNNTVIEQHIEKGKKKRKLANKDYPIVLDKRFKALTPYRNTTIQKWNEKTRIASGKLNQKSFAAFEQSALKQIDQILMDKERLIKRTQLKRSLYHILGKAEKGYNDDETNENHSVDNFKDYDPEIFDDGDFYHQLLRELIERKSADVTDPIALSRQWLEIQRLRGRMKKKVDTKASKGRKIRYDVHSKLINFMAPLDNSKMSDEAKTELFGSLFGQRNYSFAPPASDQITIFSSQK